MSALTGICACGQKLPIGGWPLATCPRCADGGRKILEDFMFPAPVPATPRPPDPRERIAALEAALELPLMFHASGPWDDAKRARWKELTGEDEATTRVMCDAIRRVLGKAA